jgi:hypothetical protein
MANYVIVLALGLAAGSLSGIIGTGASIMLLPVLVFQFGPKQAVPIMAIAALMSNIAKLLGLVARGRLAGLRGLFDYRNSCGGTGCPHASGATIACCRSGARPFLPDDDPRPALAKGDEFPDSALAACPCRCRHRISDWHRHLDGTA